MSIPKKLYQAITFHNWTLAEWQILKMFLRELEVGNQEIRTLHNDICLFYDIPNTTIQRGLALLAKRNVIERYRNNRYAKLNLNFKDWKKK